MKVLLKLVILQVITSWSLITSATWSQVKMFARKSLVESSNFNFGSTLITKIRERSSQKGHNQGQGRSSLEGDHKQKSKMISLVGIDKKWSLYKSMLSFKETQQ